MKIGILTLPFNTNYGGIIQNWALQQTLKGMNHNPITINRCKDTAKISVVNFAIHIIVFIKYAVLNFLRIRKDVVYNSPFRRKYSPVATFVADSKFIRDNISITKRIYSYSKFQKEMKRIKWDAFIVGSDQVWRQEYSPCVENYFFDVMSDADSRPRIAYAVSFGVNVGYIDNNVLEKSRLLIKHFKAVSVRERNGIDIVRKDFLHDDVMQVLDPTLLLESNDYEKLIKRKHRAKQLNVGAYIIDKNSCKKQILDEIANARALSVNLININATQRTMPSMSEWLAMFADAEYVVTDSFHGCVFSIIFKKPFVAIANRERGLDRFTSLLGMLNLSDRLVYDYDGFEANREQLLAPIDYSAVDALLEAEREKSIKFLKDALYCD